MPLNGVLMGIRGPSLHLSLPNTHTHTHTHTHTQRQLLLNISGIPFTFTFPDQHTHPFPESCPTDPPSCVVTLVPLAQDAPSPWVSRGCLTRCQFGEVLFFLSLCAKEQDAFESDALMGPQGDAHAKVMSAHDLH